MLVINNIDLTTVGNEVYNLLKSEVSEKRQRMASQYVFFDDAKRCILAELLLQYSFYLKTGSLKNIEIEHNPYGKPYVVGEEGFSFNLTHSGKWVAIAYGGAGMEIGLDIEEICFEQDDLPIHAFTVQEQTYINAASDQGERVRRFTQMWTLKESYVKYIGTGFSTDLDSFSISMGETIEVQSSRQIQENVSFKNCLFQNDYYLSLCSSEENVVFQQINLEDLMRFIYEKKRHNKVNELVFQKELMNDVMWREN